jgi:hypothetical protein
MFGFLGNLLGNAASYVTSGHPAPTPPQPDNAGGEWPDTPAEAEKKRRQKLIQDRSRAQQGKMPPGMQQPQAQQVQQQAQPAQQAQQSQGNPWQHPLAQSHFGAQNDMFAATNNAIQREMDSRAQQASEERDRQHQYSIESMRQQGAMARNQQAQQQAQQQDQAKQRKNAALLKMAGMGGHTVINGKHYPLSSLGRALIG